MLPGLPVFPAITGRSNLYTYYNGIRCSDTYLATLPFSSTSKNNERVFQIKKFYQTVLQCHRYYHLVRNNSVAQIFIEKFREI